MYIHTIKHYSALKNKMLMHSATCMHFKYSTVTKKIKHTNEHPVWFYLYKGQKQAKLGFPGGSVVGSLPASAGDAGSGPGLGGSHVPRSGWAPEPHLLSLCVWSLCPATGGAAMVKGPRTAMKSGPRAVMRSGPHLPQLEKALARTEDPTQPKINK